jgi:SAM-dependent methyltransferase
VVESKFDEAYYRRFYKDPARQVTSQREIHRLGRFVCSYLKYLYVPVDSVLDMGCGFGYWQAVIARHFPRAQYTGVEFSPYLCRTKGWTRGSVTQFESSDPFDFVVCQGVLQYLSAKDAQKGIANLARLTRWALYLEVVTDRDWKDVCDQTTTDGSVHLRSRDWYAQRLKKDFVSLGGGLFAKKDAPIHLYDIERAGW